MTSGSVCFYVFIIFRSKKCCCHLFRNLKLKKRWKTWVLFVNNGRVFSPLVWLFRKSPYFNHITHGNQWKSNHGIHGCESFTKCKFSAKISTQWYEQLSSYVFSRKIKHLNEFKTFGNKSVKINHRIQKKYLWLLKFAVLKYFIHFY